MRCFTDPGGIGYDGWLYFTCLLLGVIYYIFSLTDNDIVDNCVMFSCNVISYELCYILSLGDVNI